MKRALIFYACYGGGHISAANSMKEYIELNYPNIEPICIDFMDYLSKTIDKVTKTAYEEMAKKAPALWGSVYSRSEKGPLAKISTDSNKILAIKLELLIKKYNPDFIINPHPFSSQMCAYLKKKKKLQNIVLATIMTDFASHDQWLVGSEFIDYFFVSNSELKAELINKKIPEYKIFDTGIPLSNKFLINYDKNKIYSDFDLSNNKYTILFFAGGRFGLGKKNTKKILEDIAKYINNIQVVAVSGKNKKMENSFNLIVEKYNREKDIKIIEYTDRVPELMNISDIIISKPGGLTTSESLACEVPLVIINPIPGQEEKNAEFIEKNHLGYWIKKDDTPIGVIYQAITDKNTYNLYKENIKKFAKKNSTQNICKILFENKH